MTCMISSFDIAQMIMERMRYLRYFQRDLFKIYELIPMMQVHVQSKLPDLNCLVKQSANHDSHRCKKFINDLRTLIVTIVYMLVYGCGVVLASKNYDWLQT